MNIAMFTNNYKPFIGGVPISIERLSEGLRSLGHKVTVFAPEPDGRLSGNPEEDVVRFKVIYRKADRGMALGNCFDKKIETCFRNGEFDVIHVHHPVLVGQTALYLGKKYNIPVAYTYHTRYEEYLHHFKLYEAMASDEYPVSWIARYGKEVLVPSLITAFTNKCGLVFAPTNTIKEHLLEQGTKTRISVLPTGLDQAAFESDKIHSAGIRALYSDGCPYLFATTARLEKEKNLEFLLRGAACLKGILGEGFRLMVIGDGTERARLDELAGLLGISRQIVFTGKIENTQVRHYLNAADAFLFTSRSETQGIVLLEAMAAGCPVTAVRASGVVDVVRQGVNGYMTAEDPDAFAVAAARLVLDQDVWSRMSDEARRTAQSYESGRIAALAAEQYGFMIRQKKDAGYGEHGKRMFVPSILRLFGAA